MPFSSSGQIRIASTFRCTSESTAVICTFGSNWPPATITFIPSAPACFLMPARIAASNGATVGGTHPIVNVFFCCAAPVAASIAGPNGQDSHGKH